MLKLTAAAAVSTLLIATAPADAKTFRGKTNQGRTASLVTGADGVPKSVRVSWRAPCKKPGFRAMGGTRFTAPFTAAFLRRSRTRCMACPFGLQMQPACVTVRLGPLARGREIAGTTLAPRTECL